MDITAIAKLGSLLRATIVDYTILHEKMSQIIAIGDELVEATTESYPEISRKYLSAIESYLVANSILKAQYENLQGFAQEIPISKTEVRRNKEITKAQLELMNLDLDYMNLMPSLREIIGTINEILISAGTLQGETLIMIGVVKDGEVRV